MKLYDQDISWGPGPKSDENAWISYATILALFFATIWGTFAILRSSRPLMSVDVANAAAVPHLGKVAVAGCIALVLAFLAAVAGRPTRHAPEQEPTFIDVRVRLALPAAGLAVVALALWASAPWIFLLTHRGVRLGSTIFPNSLSAIPFVVFTLVACGWIGYTSADSIFSNVADIELLRFSRSAWLVAGAAGAATASTALWVFVEAFFSTSAPVRVDSLALVASMVCVGNLAITSATTLVFTRSWPRYRGRFPFMALHHAAPNVANDHFMQTAFLFVAIVTAYAGWRWLDWSSVPRTAGDTIAGYLVIALPFTVAIAFVRGLNSGTERHLTTESMRVTAGKAEAIQTRAGDDLLLAQILNNERLDKIRKRFVRVQRQSKILTLYLPAFLIYASRRLFPE